MPEGARRRTTIRELAEYTGLSPAAVSYALRGTHVSAETERRVREAAEQLEGQRSRAVERVRARDDAAVDPERIGRGGDCALGLPIGRGLDRPRQHGDAVVAELAEVLKALLYRALVVEDHLTGRGHAGQRIADRDRGHLSRDRLPSPARRADRHDDQPVDAVVDETLGELQLARGLPVGVGDQRAAVRLVQLALHGANELLVPEVGQAADEQPDDGGRPTGQGARDRIGLIAELVRGLAHSALGLGRYLLAAQRVAHSGR